MTAPLAAAMPGEEPLRIVILGLSITSSWGNGHATNYRGLVRALSARGHDVLFLERDLPWYADNRDLPHPPDGRTVLYRSLPELRARHAADVAQADLVVVGSYVPDGIEIGRWVASTAAGVRAFFDLDTPVTLAAVDEDACAYLDRDLIAAYDLYLSFTGGPTLDRLRRLGARRPVTFHCFVDPDAYRPASVRTRWALGYLGTYSVDRQPMLERLLVQPARLRPELRFVVAGARYPREIRWPANVERIEHLPPGAHPAFFGAQTLTLNVTRAEMVRAGWSPSVRLFEAAACATPVVSDRWDGLGALFVEGKEILVADDTGEVLELLDSLPPAMATRIGRRARRRVLAGHTAAHRAAALEHVVLRTREGGGTGPRPSLGRIEPAGADRRPG
ncbi:MAG: hypothetical protein JWN46_3641 [Acidimicrobiales bacterium]|nr:hypothetical protein [Acidimicrobiales bacterium]